MHVDVEPHIPWPAEYMQDNWSRDRLGGTFITLHPFGRFLSKVTGCFTPCSFVLSLCIGVVSFEPRLCADLASQRRSRDLPFVVLHPFVKWSAIAPGTRGATTSIQLIYVQLGDLKHRVRRVSNVQYLYPRLRALLKQPPRFPEALPSTLGTRGICWHDRTLLPISSLVLIKLTDTANCPKR